MRRTHGSWTAPRLCAGTGDLAKTPSGRKQAPHPRASGDEAGVSQWSRTVQGEARMPSWTFQNTCARLARLFVTECNSHGKVLLSQVATC